MAADQTNQEQLVTSGSETKVRESNDTQQKDHSNTRTSSRRSRNCRQASMTKQNKHFVEHNYHDHSHDAVEASSLGVSDDGNDNGLKKRRGHRGGVAVPFPEKLHFMLSRMDAEDTADIVTWQTHGRCFVVHKPKEFVEQIMPRYFRQTKMTSFQRQLNLYGFSRLTAGPDRGGYYHELFLRARLDLCKRMCRTRVKGNGSKAAYSPSTEPNFYAMEPCRETETPVPEEGTQQASYEGLAMIPDTDEMSKEPSNAEGNVVVGLPTDDGSLNDTTPEPGQRDDDAECIRVPPSTPPMGSPVHRSVSWSSIPPPLTVEKCAVPIVSPLEQRTLVSPARSPQLLASLSLPQELPDSAHSGDQIFFEGLPFHYLETKDVEDSLLMVDI